ncbi:Hypothetical predicted protein [Xyrichtys novacula]|uniref:Uncharacterized protein n=1 Tax=Xyrichtys novacula TaxID=13765 RepID=A0AAV1GLT5_XYRNO|nr:Hypothetical predicted protein [Xyrichtys novacula]
MPNSSFIIRSELSPPSLKSVNHQEEKKTNLVYRNGLLLMHSWLWFYLFANLYVGSLPLVLFSMEVSGGGGQMQYYNTVNKCVYRNKSDVESVNSICCHSRLCQKTRNLFTYFITC